MARADKSALISKAVAAFRAREFVDYSKAAAYYGVGRTTVSRRVKGLQRPGRRLALFTTNALPMSKKRS